MDNHHTYAARLRYHNEYGVEVQILRDDDVLVGYRFQTRARAVNTGQISRANGPRLLCYDLRA